MSVLSLHRDIGPFARVRRDADQFCHNLFLSYTMNECAVRLEKIEKEYDEAVLREDNETAEQKKLEIQAYKSSMSLTALMFDEIGEVST
jgi:hypothetical protein